MSMKVVRDSDFLCNHDNIMKAINNIFNYIIHLLFICKTEGKIDIYYCVAFVSLFCCFFGHHFPNNISVIHISNKICL